MREDWERRGPTSAIPYCGLPPHPGEMAWNLDPILLTLSIAGVFLLVWWSNRTDRRQALMGWAIAAALLISPLCSLSVALFSARVAQHLMLILLAAPLLARAWPTRGSVLLPVVAFTITLWFWHLPAPYLLTFESHLAYGVMQLSLLAAATWLWASLQHSAVERPFAALVAILGTSAQMAALGAFLTLSPRALFEAAHRPDVTGAWGLTPLEDQQLGGVLMWGPGGLLFVAGGMAIVAIMLRPRQVG